MTTRSSLLLAALLALLLVACDPPQEFGPNTTDVEMWDVNDIRVDTEVPDQYPEGRTRDEASSDHGSDHDATGEGEHGVEPIHDATEGDEAHAEDAAGEDAHGEEAPTPDEGH